MRCTKCRRNIISRQFVLERERNCLDCFLNRKLLAGGKHGCPGKRTAGDIRLFVVGPASVDEKGLTEVQIMKVKLPISWPITETYQHSSFSVSIICAHDNIKNAYENNYINLLCYDTDNLWEMNLNFTDIFWTDFQRGDIFEINEFSVDNFLSNSISSFWRERIDQGNYLLLHTVDEYYLPYASSYHNRHLIHDTYIYGYEDDSFWIMAYTERKLKEIKVSSSDMAQSVFPSKEYMKEACFWSLRPNKTIKVEIDYKKIKHYFYEYLGNNCSTRESMENNQNKFKIRSNYRAGYAYGNRIYDVLINCLIKFMESSENSISLDLRPFRLLWEHKRIIEGRIKLIIAKYNLHSDALSDFENIVRLSNQIFILCLKYTVTMKKDILERVVGKIKELKVREEMLLSNFLSMWEKRDLDSVC
jgi:hypothetical protein|nr:hypothetical protein [uncultured Acetatifactor sp.]